MMPTISPSPMLTLACATAYFVTETAAEINELQQVMVPFVCLGPDAI